MEKETAYSNLMGSNDELLLIASMGVQEDFIQRVSSAVCKSMRNECVKDYDTICRGHDIILTNFLKNCQYCGQSSFPSGCSTHLNEDFKGKNNSGHLFGQGERYYSPIIKDQLHHIPYNDDNYGPPNGNQ